jgi:PadR family transcriptional regulator PadR
MSPYKSDLPQGTLDLLILKVIALGPVHGYAIAQRLEQVSCGVVQVPEGSLYPALHRLENRRLLAADWKETETGREAKFYRLTRKGLKQLKTEAADWQRLVDAIALVETPIATNANGSPARKGTQLSSQTAHRATNRQRHSSG